MTDTLEFNQRYVVRHGRRILVETLPEIVVASKPKKGGLFGKVPLSWVVSAAKAVNCPAAVILVYLKHLEWKYGPTFTLPNVWLKRAGVSRKVKYRVLRDLEVAGVIAVEYLACRSSPRIRML
jgi:hypothetical protein